jgi:hypothetical protein
MYMATYTGTDITSFTGTDITSYTGTDITSYTCTVITFFDSVSGRSLLKYYVKTCQRSTAARTVWPA